MKLAIFLIALTCAVCATPSIQYGKNHNRNPVEGDDFKVPVVEIDHNFQEILMKIEENEEYEDNLNIPIDSPKEHMGLHYIDTLEEMQSMGVNTQSIDPDLIEDAFLLVVSIATLYQTISVRHWCSFNSQNLSKNMDIQLNVTLYGQLTVIC